VLILARHGQTGPNARGLLLGRLDPPLTDEGRAQAAAVARAIGTPDLVVSSPLGRARETAAALGVPVTVDERWIEVDYGTYDGVPFRDVPADVWRQWRDDPEWAPPGGESMADVGRRVRAACDDLVEAATAGDVVVVSHVSPIKAAVGWALGVGNEIAWRMFLDVAAVCRVAIGPWGPSLRVYNDTAHLG
jgi:broad specificity phosphatase PhoE